MKATLKMKRQQTAKALAEARRRDSHTATAAKFSSAPLITPRPSVLKQSSMPIAPSTGGVDRSNPDPFQSVPITAGKGRSSPVSNPGAGPIAAAAAANAAGAGGDVKSSLLAGIDDSSSDSDTRPPKRSVTFQTNSIIDASTNPSPASTVTSQTAAAMDRSNNALSAAAALNALSGNGTLSAAETEAELKYLYTVFLEKYDALQHDAVKTIERGTVIDRQLTALETALGGLTSELQWQEEAGPTVSAPGLIGGGRPRSEGSLARLRARIPIAAANAAAAALAAGRESVSTPARAIQAAANAAAAANASAAAAGSPNTVIGSGGSTTNTDSLSRPLLSSS